ncbi:MAG TPA: hypothetical protein VFH47_03835, partial [Candidatus Thermoplasmatota archaeon]|nr:hypothetical protein [Candidatus Thermoplasmatota archaeon]
GQWQAEVALQAGVTQAYRVSWCTDGIAVGGTGAPDAGACRLLGPLRGGQPLSGTGTSGPA